MEKMYSFNEIGLIPAVKSQIKSRKDVNPFIEHHNERVEKLPIFIAPMTCLIDRYNYDKINTDTSFIPILPVRPDTKDYTQDLSSGWRACTIAEFREIVESREKTEEEISNHYQICIDCANGHMEELFDLVPRYKKYNCEAEIMVGNIANPETYLECCKAGIDYVRVGIGGGSGCTTSVQTGFHASLPWLLREIQNIKNSFSPWDRACKAYGWTNTKIVADGGINDFHKIVKALALGADYVMIGKMFATTNLACGAVRVKQLFDERHYYGQSSELGQRDRFGYVKSNPEGTDVWVKIGWETKAFSKKIEDVIRSAMSYANAKTLEEFIGEVRFEIQSAEEFNSYNK